MFFFFGLESFMSMSNVFLQGKKETDIGVLLLPRTRNILVPKTEFITPKNYGFFSQRTSMWRYKMLLTDSILGTMISLSFSIFLDMKISGVTLFGGMAD